jgi:hypothetical protein
MVSLTMIQTMVGSLTGLRQYGLYFLIDHTNFCYKLRLLIHLFYTKTTCNCNVQTHILSHIYVVRRAYSLFMFVKYNQDNKLPCNYELMARARTTSAAATEYTYRAV